MEDEDYRIMVLNDTTMKVFRDGRIHTYDSYRKKWCQRKLTEREDGYQKIDIGCKPRKTYLVHRIMALCYLGERPNGLQIDHINSIKTDNRLENLRYLSQLQNTRNRLTMNGRNTKGYSITKHGKFRARIRHYDKFIDLGSYDTEDEARQAYVEGKLKYHKVKIENKQ